MRAAAAVALLALASCAPKVPFAAFPGDPLPPEILEGWAEAQEILLELEPPLASDPRRIPPTLFTWIEQTRAHRCGETNRAGGCFSSNRDRRGHLSVHVVQYIRDRRIIVHEAIHAIAYAAGDPRWRDIPH